MQGDSQPPQEAVVRHINGDSSAGSAAGAGALDGETGEEGEEGYGSDETGEAIERAFDGLIQAAYELVQEGKPMDAEFILREGGLVGGWVGECIWREVVVSAGGRWCLRVCDKLSVDRDTLGGESVAG